MWRGGQHRNNSMCAVVAIAVGVLATGVGVLIGSATTGAEWAPSWRALPDAPISGHLASAVWTGTEMIVWGGGARDASGRLIASGAAYDPAERSWRPIAPAPAGVERGAALGWTGDRLVVWASNSPDGPVGAGVYNPATDRWRELPAGPLGRRESYASAWTGTELLVVGGSLGDTLATPIAAALDPDTGAWRLLPALNSLTGLLPGAALTWNGHEAFLLGSVCAERLTSCSSVLLGYDPATDALRTIDLSRAPITEEQQLSLVGWSGGKLVFTIVGVPSNVNSGRIAVVRLDPHANSWHKGVFAPFPGTSGVNHQTAWLGDRLVVPDGSSGLQVYRLDTDAWETLTPGPSPLNTRTGSAIAWTGDELIAWSGMPFERGNPTPADGASLSLPD
jgi:hypothetical protein